MTKNTSENTKELPKGWEWKKLGEVFIVKDGTHNTPKYILDSGFPLVTSKNLKDSGLDLKDVNFISKEDYDEINHRSKVDKGDLLFAMIDTIGNPTIINIEVNFAIKNVTLFKRKTDNRIDFLRYFFLSPITKNRLNSEANGATQKFVGLGYLRSFEIPLPPLKEQERIVQKLDSAFQSLDEAITLQKQTIVHTQELKKAILVHQISNLDCEMKNILEGITMSNKTVIPKNDEIYNYVGLENIQRDTGQLVAFEPQIGSEIKSNKVFFKKGMVLYGKLRPYLNKVYVAEFDGIATTEILPFLCKDNLNPYFLAYYLRSDDFVNIVSECTQGSRMPRLRTEFWKSEAQIPLPPLPEQEKIVAYLDTSFAKLDALMVEQQARLAQLMALKRVFCKRLLRGNCNTIL